MFTFTSLIPHPCYPQTKYSCSLSHTPVCAPKCFILSPRKVTKVVHPYQTQNICVEVVMKISKQKEVLSRASYHFSLTSGKLKTKNKSTQQLIKMFSSMILIRALYMSVRNYLFHIHIAPACISNGTSWFWTWRLITCLSLPTSCWPMNTAGKLCRNPSCTSALSICCPFVILSSS